MSRNNRGFRFAIAASTALAIPAAAHANVIISSAATENVSCSAGVCAPTAKKAVLNANDLENYIAQQGNISVTTTGSGVEAGTMEIDAALSWSQASVTLNAKDSIRVTAPVSIGAATSELEIHIAAGSTDVLSFGPKGHITFASLSDIFGINGGIFTLENSVQGLAAAIDANPSGAYALANNYDASQEGTYSNSPVTTALGGTVEGLGNTISHLSISAKQGRGGTGEVGLFSEIGTGGTVAAIRLSELNSKARGSFHTGIYLGGLVGTNNGLLFDDSVAGKLDVNKYGTAGGLVGINKGTITTSFTSVRIGGTGGAGLVEYNLGTISLSHAGGDARCGGGLVNDNEGEISQSYATTYVSCSDESYPWGGGLVGINGNSDYTADINNSYATGGVTGGLEVGGFAGDDRYDTIEYSYSTGAVSAGGESDLGGFSGSFTYEDYFTDCYWDTTTSGTSFGVDGFNIPEVVGLTTQQLQSGLPTGFDPKIWAENPKINNGLPYLINNPPEKK